MKMLPYSRSLNSVLCGAGLVLATGCATVPTVTARGAEVLAKGKRRTDAGGAMPLIVPSSERDQPTYNGGINPVGGLQQDFSFRKGLGGGREQAIRVGAGLFGLYAGYERAAALTEPGKAGVSIFGGAVGGAHYGTGNAWPFVQPYAGLVAGTTGGRLGLEAVLRAAGQTGLISRDKSGKKLYAYALGIALVEPRVRIHASTYELYLGLQVGTGLGRCQECFRSVWTEPLLIVSPTLGFSFD